MSTGNSNDILSRVKRLIPFYWFSFVAPFRDAVLGGLSDLAAHLYGFIVYAQSQARVKTANGPLLDVLAYDFLGRNILRNGASDSVFRALILSTILQERVTRAGMVNIMTKLTGFAPFIFEPWNPNDTGVYAPGSPLDLTFNVATSGSTTTYTPTQYVTRAARPGASASFGYGIGQGGYGNMNLPAQVFMKQNQGAGSGIPLVTGYSSEVKDVVVGAGGYGVGAITYDGPLSSQSGLTQAMIQAAIVNTKPSGGLVWLQIT